MTILGRSEELVSRCVECDLAEPESLASLGGSAPGVVDGILSVHEATSASQWHDITINIGEDGEEHYDVIDMQIEAQRAVRRITDHQEIVKQYQKW